MVREIRRREPSCARCGHLAETHLEGLGCVRQIETRDPRLKAFMETITPEQMGKLQGILGPGQIISPLAFRPFGLSAALPKYYPLHTPRRFWRP